MTAVSIESLSKSFGSTRAVRELSLTVDAGQIFGLLGPNGSGKSTTLACLLGLLRPDSGHSELLGVPSRQIHRTAGRVGVVFDTPSLVGGLTARQNLAYAGRTLGHPGGRGLDDCLALVGLGELGKRRAGRMSLGQKRRLSIARALLGSPELLVLDEPLSGLDPVGVRQMLQLFRRLRDDGLTLVLSSHRLHEMEQVVSHVAILAGGRVLRSGTLQDVLAGDEPRVRVHAGPADQVRGILARLEGVELLGESDVGRRPLVDDEDLAGDLVALDLSAYGEPGTAVPTAPAPAAAANGDDRRAFLLRCGGLPTSVLNRTLVEAGCDVAAVIPEQSSLPALFNRMVQESEA